MASGWRRPPDMSYELTFSSWWRGGREPEEYIPTTHSSIFLISCWCSPLAESQTARNLLVILPSKAGAGCRRVGSALKEQREALGTIILPVEVDWASCLPSGIVGEVLPSRRPCSVSAHSPFQELTLTDGLPAPGITESSTFWKHFTSHLRGSMLSAQLLQSSATALGRSQAFSSSFRSNHAHPGAPTSLSSQETGLKAMCKFKFFQ